MLFSLGFPIVIEFIQLFINRNVDIDDVLLNFLGSVLGALIYTFLRKKFPEFALIEK
jgi:glycopeptide antibiotics resistance protein